MLLQMVIFLYFHGLLIFHIVFIHLSVDEHLGCFHVFCCCFVTKSCPTCCDPVDCSTPGFPVLHYICRSWLKLMSTESVMPSNHLILCCPLLLLPSVFSSIRVFINSSHQVAKLLELQLQHQSFQWIFRVDFLLDWLVWCAYSPRDSQKSSLTPQFKASILWHLDFFMV